MALDLSVEPPFITVVGSLNMDLVVTADRLPRPGETVLGKQFATFPGGKGANQAVAAARAGGRTAILGSIGQDTFGGSLLAAIDSAGVATAAVLQRDDAATGVALITVAANGENCIVVAPGANALLSPVDVAAASSLLRQASHVLVQLEIPLPAVAETIATAAAAGATVILDPAPAPSMPLPPAWLNQIKVLTPNEHELYALTGADQASGPTAAAAALAARGVETVIVTLGADGVLWTTAASPDDVKTVPAFPVTAVDTTGAGDAFAGALAVALAEGKSMDDAIHFAQAAAAVAVTRHGAQSALPLRSEIEALLRSPV